MLLNETKIVRELCRRLAKIGFFAHTVSDEDCSDDTTESVQSNTHLLELLAGLDTAIIVFVNNKAQEAWAHLIFDNGNYGLDVISDHATVPADFNQVIDDLMQWIDDNAVLTLPESEE